MFKFQLENILGLREKTEQTKKRELGVLNQKYAQVEIKLMALQQAVKMTYELLRTTSQGKVDCVERQHYQYYLKKQRFDEEQLCHELKQIQTQINNKKDELLEAVKERKILQNLKERQFQDYLKEQNEIEQKLVDELVSYKYTQKSQGEQDAERI